MDAIERYPAVLKADGLAAGKGVVIAPGEAAAREALEAFLVERRFGTETVVVEEYLDGEELSMLALCDGERAIPMAPAQDYKRIFDGDLGPNTGGMGSYSPVPGVDEERAAALVAQIHQPIVDLMRERGTPVSRRPLRRPDADGGRPARDRVQRALRRSGDPGAAAAAALGPVRSCCSRRRAPADWPGARLDWSDQWAVSVVLASAGYPESSSSGQEIHGLDRVPAGAEVTHAGTARRDGAFVTAGGRVLGVTALGADAAAAREAAYAAAGMIEFDGRQMRRDIALRAVERAR